MVVDIDSTRAESVASELRTKGITSAFHVADVSDPTEIEGMVAATVAALGGLHVAVNNAGVNYNSAAEETPVCEWDATFALNARGVFLCCQV